MKVQNKFWQIRLAEGFLLQAVILIQKLEQTCIWKEPIHNDFISKIALLTKMQNSSIFI